MIKKTSTHVFTQTFNLGIPLLVLLVLGIFMASACKPDYSKEIQKADNFYQEAVSYDKNYNYAKAIDALTQAIALDTIVKRHEELIKYYNLLSHIQNKVGQFENALHSIEAGLALISPDSLSTQRVFLNRKVAIYKLIEQNRQAIQILEKIDSLSLQDQLTLAELYLREHEPSKAYRIFSEVAKSKSSKEKMRAYSGLMEVFLQPPVTKSERDSLAVLVKSIINLARLVEERNMAPEQKCEIYRIAALSLARIEEQKRNGSFFMFKALAQAKLTNNDMLQRTVAFEANALVVRRASNIEVALNYFKQKGYQKGMLQAYALLGMEKSYANEQRIEYLKKGLKLYQEIRFIGMSVAMNRAVVEGFYQLISLLIEQNRYLEAYEVSETLKMIDQHREFDDKDLSIIPKEYRNTVKELSLKSHIISALQFLMDSTAYLNEEDQKVRRNLISRVLAKHQGEYYSKLSQLRQKQRNLAELFEPIPITLPTLQSILPESVAVADIFYSEDQVTVIFIAPDKANVFQAKLPKEIFDRAMDAFRWDFLENDQATLEELRQNYLRKRLSNAFVAGLEKELHGINRLIVFSNVQVPFHILGRESFLQEQVAISYLTSAKQLQMSAQIAAPKYVEFIKLTQTKQIPIEFFLNQREKVMLWKDLKGQERAEQKIIYELALSSSNSIAEMLHEFAVEKILQDDISWIGFSAYGF